MEEGSEKFNQEMKKLREERPTFTEEKYREYARLWTDYMKQQYAEFKSGKTAQVDEPMEVSKENEETPTVENEEIDNAAKEPENETTAENPEKNDKDNGTEDNSNANFQT